jgi:hypothetical protein
MHRDGLFTTSGGVIDTFGGRTSAFDDLGNPVQHDGGWFRSSPW